MREIKFRFWDTELNEMTNGFGRSQLVIRLSGTVNEGSTIPKGVLMQYTGLKDKEEQEWFVEDIGEFDNGDKFVIKMEDWLEVYVDWIGDPECEDQARDLYRIENAKKIGNSFENPELLEQ